MGNPLLHEVTIPNDATFLAKLRHELLGVLGQGGVSKEISHLIILAIDEAVANVIEHGFEPEVSSDSQKIQVMLEIKPKQVEVCIRDRGRPFDPKSIPENVDLSESVRLGKKGGLGIYLIRTIMDEVQYVFKRCEHNELYMVKYIDKRSAKATSEQTSRREGVL